MKQLDPLIVCLGLFACELVYRDTFTPALGAYATLAFIVTRPIFDRLDIRDAGHSFSDFSRTYLRIVLHWSSVIAVLLFAAFAFKFSSDMSRMGAPELVRADTDIAVGRACHEGARSLVGRKWSLGAAAHHRRRQ